MRKSLLLIFITAMFAFIIGCSDDTPFNPFENCHPVDNPQEVLLGKWKCVLCCDEYGKNLTSATSYIPIYLEFFSDGTFNETIWGGGNPDMTYTGFVYNIVDDTICTVSTSHQFGFFANNNNLILKQIKGIFLGVSPFLTIGYYERAKGEI